MQIQEITRYIEQLAPLAYQESYDNAGLITGNPKTEISGILISLDCTEEVVDEAIQKGCNLIVAHHPIVFKGLKKLNGKNYVERTVIKAIKNDIAVYASHTNLDHVKGGVNFKIAEKLKLTDCRILAPKKQILKKLVVFVPFSHTPQVTKALCEAGAGQIGEYFNCSFQTSGIGSFTPSESTNPFIGEALKPEKVEENRVEVILPSHLEREVLQAMKTAHPYEEVAYYLTLLENTDNEVGAGVIGTLSETLTEEDFLHYLKNHMQLKSIRHTRLLNRNISRIAVCGGAGSFLLSDAIRQKADVFITADYKYHEFFDAEENIIICDIGHYESEVFTKDLIHSYLSKKITNFAILKSEVNTNPVQYF